MMVSTVIPPRTNAGPTGRQLLLTALEYQRAADIQGAIQREVAWLRQAWSCYGPEVLERLLRYSADRLRYRIEREFGTATLGVRLSAAVADDAPPAIRVWIGWSGDDGRRLLRAWTDMIDPRARA